MDEMKLLFDRLDWSRPELSEAKALLDHGKENDCMDALIRHFSGRTAPVYLFDREELKKCKDPGLIEDAEEVMRHKIYGYQFEGDIDWMFNPTAETSRDNEWSWSLYRNIYWQPLMRAYMATGDERYAKEYAAQLKSFVKVWPVKPFMEDEEYEKKNFSFPGCAWRTIETGIRIYTTWLPCFEVFRKSPSMDRETWIAFLNGIHDHAEFLMKHYSNHRSSSNWLTMESSALLQCGVMFPELKNSAVWMQMGYRRFTHEVKYSFDNEGIHIERTPIYHMVSVISFLQAWRICVLNHIPVPPYAFPTLEKGAEFLMKLVKPDFSTPMIGDADRNDLLARRSDTSVYEGMNLSFDPYDLNEMRAFFRTMYELTGREDFLYFATGREKGHSPDAKNYAMKDAGIYVMRTGWEPQDSYFHVHGIQMERGEKSSHSHNDQCHLELQIRGEDVLIDSGRYIYNSSCWKQWRHYFLSACAHNTIFIDDQDISKPPLKDFRSRKARTYCHRFEKTPQYSVIDLSHNSFAYEDDPIFHRRRVIRLSGDVYIIDDQLTGLGLSEHDIRLYFNFAPGKLEHISANDYEYTTQKGSKFTLRSLINDGYSSRILYGSEDPIGGWVSYGYPNREPIPQLHLSAKGPVPLRFLTVILPEGTSCSGSADMNHAALSFTGIPAKELILNGDNILVK